MMLFHLGRIASRRQHSKMFHFCFWNSMHIILCVSNANKKGYLKIEYLRNIGSNSDDANYDDFNEKLISNDLSYARIATIY